MLYENVNINVFLDFVVRLIASEIQIWNKCLVNFIFRKKNISSQLWVSIVPTH